jgi:hypothetical protein
MKFEKIHFIGKFYVNNIRYRYIDIPLEAFYFYKSNKDDVGAWTGKSNITNQNGYNPCKNFHSLENAFKKMAEWRQDKKTFCGIIKDFFNETVYYDNDIALRYWKYHLEEFKVFKHHIKVTDWNTVPTKEQT